MFNINLTREKTSAKRLEIIITITTLSVLLIGSIILSAILYTNNITSQNQIQAVRNAISNASVATDSSLTATDLLYELGNIYESKYVGEIDDEAMKQSLLDAFFDNIDDPYSSYYSAVQYEALEKTMSGAYYGIGVTVSSMAKGLLVSKVFAGSPADEGGIQNGDIITTAAGTSLVGMATTDATNIIRTTEGETIEIKYLRNDIEYTVNLVRRDFNIPTVELSYLEENGKKIGYIIISQFYENTFREFKQCLQQAETDGADGIIFDLRNNSGGYLASVEQCLDYILGEGIIVTVKYKNEASTLVVEASEEYHCTLPMVVLANGNTASAAELFSACLKDHQRATLIGTKTFGKGCGQELISLKDGSTVKLTTFYFETPVTGNFNKVGINPDVEVANDEKYLNYDITSIPAGEDLQLQSAVDHLTR